MKERYYFVIYPCNDGIKTILDGMKIVADPSQRNHSHITVKGPYQRAEKGKLLKDNKLIEGKEIKVNGAGHFFTESQNTVYLRCETREGLYDIWKGKTDKTYKEFNPHITIYDGNDRAFASELYETIQLHSINFSFLVDKLDLYSSKDKERIFNLTSEVDYSLLSEIANLSITRENINDLSEDQRVTLIDGLCSRLIEICNSDRFAHSAMSIKNHAVLVEA